MLYLDIHTHQTAQQNGVISIQSLSLTNDIFLAMPKKKPVSIGLHPWYARLEHLELHMKYMAVLARQTNVKMIGECGLDKLKGECLENQLHIFERQVRLAEELGKPVIIHCVKAFEELISLKKRLNPQVPMIVHGFQKKAALAGQLIRHGFYLSFGAALQTSDELRHLIQEMNSPFFLETDDATIPIAQLYKYAAEIKKINVEDLKDRIFDSWKAIGLI